MSRIIQKFSFSSSPATVCSRRRNRISVDDIILSYLSYSISFTYFISIYLISFMLPLHLLIRSQFCELLHKEVGRLTTVQRRSACQSACAVCQYVCVHALFTLVLSVWLYVGFTCVVPTRSVSVSAKIINTIFEFDLSLSLAYIWEGR